MGEQTQSLVPSAQHGVGRARPPGGRRHDGALTATWGTADAPDASLPANGWSGRSPATSSSRRPHDQLPDRLTGSARLTVAAPTMTSGAPRQRTVAGITTIAAPSQ